MSSKKTAEQYENENNAILRKAARTAQQTVEIANDNSRVLAEQGEVIDKIDRTLDDTQKKIGVANYVLKSMSGFKGIVYGIFASAPKAQTPTPTPLVPTRTEKVEAAAAPSTAKGSSRLGGLTPSSPQQSEEDKLLDMISNSVSLLKENARETGTTLNCQNKKLARVEEKADQTTGMIKKAAIKTRTIT